MCNDDGTIADHDRGLDFDLSTLRRQRTQHRHRRAVLGMIGAGAVAGGGALLLGGSSSAATATAAGSSTTTTTTGSCTAEELPTETAGPYPGDGSNGPDVLEESGVVRRDIRSSFGDASATAAGVDLAFVMTLRDTSTCKAVSGLAVYAWHCNALGEYSMYSGDVADENYLRGVQITNGKGKVRFDSIYPGCYSGRWPHIHFEVYRSRKEALNGGSVLLTSQLALPRTPSMAVYRGAASTYPGSEANLDRVSLRSDGVFGDDGGARQLASTTGSVTKGYVAKLVVPIDL